VPVGCLFVPHVRKLSDATIQSLDAKISESRSAVAASPPAAAETFSACYFRTVLDQDEDALRQLTINVLEY
jgi:hypothetical protein